MSEHILEIRHLSKAFGLSHLEDTIYLGTLLGSLGSHTFQSSQVS